MNNKEYDGGVFIIPDNEDMLHLLKCLKEESSKLKRNNKERFEGYVVL